MERISEYDLAKELMSVYAGGQVDNDVVRLALQELKERREADSKPLDIKGQLRLVRDKCPDVWEMKIIGCPSDWFVVKDNFCNIDGICKNIWGNCWDEALGGDE